MKWVCTVCGYVHEGAEPPAECPICHVPASMFKAMDEERNWAAEHVVGIAQGVDPEIVAGLRSNFEGECSEVGMYLAMARVAHREGYPEIGLYWEKAAFEEAEHAAKFAELLGEVVTDSTKKNLEMSTAQPRARPTSLRRLRNSDSTLSMTPFMKWQGTKQDTARLLRDYLRDILVNGIAVLKNFRESGRNATLFFVI